MRPLPDAVNLSGRTVPKFLATGMRVLAFGGPVSLRQRDMTIVIPAGSSAVGKGYCLLSGGPGTEAVLEVVR